MQRQATPATSPAREADRYGDLRGRFEPDIIDRHGGMLRHAMRCDIPPGYYAIRPAVIDFADPDKLVTYQIDDLGRRDPRLRGYVAVFRLDGLLAPRRAVDGILRRIEAAGPDLAAARFRRLPCDRCGRRRGGDATCLTCERCMERSRRTAQAQVIAARQRPARRRGHLTLIEGGER